MTEIPEGCEYEMDVTQVYNSSEHVVYYPLE